MGEKTPKEIRACYHSRGEIPVGHRHLESELWPASCSGESTLQRRLRTLEAGAQHHTRNPAHTTPVSSRMGHHPPHRSPVPGKPEASSDGRRGTEGLPGLGRGTENRPGAWNPEQRRAEAGHGSQPSWAQPLPPSLALCARGPGREPLRAVPQNATRPRPLPGLERTLSDPVSVTRGL